MSKEFKIGEMRTQIAIMEPLDGINENGFPTREWKDVFRESLWCKWVNPHGREVYEQMRLELHAIATLTMRYTPRIHERCRIFRKGDPRDDAHAYEIVSMDNVQDRCKVLEIKVRRVVNT